MCSYEKTPTAQAAGVWILTASFEQSSLVSIILCNGERSADNRFRDSVGADALGADLHLLYAFVRLNADALQVGVVAALGNARRLAAVAAKVLWLTTLGEFVSFACSLAADRTFARHFSDSWSTCRRNCNGHGLFGWLNSVKEAKEYSQTQTDFKLGQQASG